MSEERELLAYAKLGEDAQKFRLSELGRYLFGMAEQESRLAAIEMARLNSLSPNFDEAFNREQKRIQCALWFEDWIAEIIAKGTEAFMELDQRRHSES